MDLYHEPHDGPCLSEIADALEGTDELIDIDSETIIAIAEAAEEAVSRCIRCGSSHNDRTIFCADCMTFVWQQAVIDQPTSPVTREWVRNATRA